MLALICSTGFPTHKIQDAGEPLVKHSTLS